jgi:hypothetical protein
MKLEPRSGKMIRRSLKHNSHCRTVPHMTYNDVLMTSINNFQHYEYIKNKFLTEFHRVINYCGL